LQLQQPPNNKKEKPPSIFEGLFIEKIDARNGTERILCCTKQICAFGRFFEKLTRCGTSQGSKI